MSLKGLFICYVHKIDRKNISYLLENKKPLKVNDKDVGAKTGDTDVFQGIIHLARWQNCPKK